MLSETAIDFVEEIGLMWNKQREKKNHTHKSLTKENI